LNHDQEQIYFEGFSQEKFIDDLLLKNFPLAELSHYPISAIETMASQHNGGFRGACCVGCLACCADAVHPSSANNPLIMLTPKLLHSFLNFTDSLVKQGIDILSTGRLNLFSASNELDHPDALSFRQILSTYILKKYGMPLGHFSSDIVFHVSKSHIFQRNLRSVVDNGLLWDNLCIAIDEQIPFQNQRDYMNYLDHLRETWETLRPALRSELPHAKRTRQNQPRVILNMLIPSQTSSFRPEHRRLYEGGPFRATTYDELILRYIKPFFGGLTHLTYNRPLDHEYTTGYASLDAFEGSSVYIAAGVYAQQGRAQQLLEFTKSANKPTRSVIRTKLTPINSDSVQIRATLATGFATEDEIEVAHLPMPEWFHTLNTSIISFA
jgi:hypothetical protein